MAVKFYPYFPRWAAWGQQLMALHLGYESVEPYPLTRTDRSIATPDYSTENLFGHSDAKAKTQRLKVKLKADKTTGTIEIDEATTLSGIPPEAWDYKLGNRSALEWVLDQYKEKKPGDPTIAEKFNTYRFADYKEDVIALLGKVCWVSLETVGVVREMLEFKKKVL